MRTIQRNEPPDSLGKQPKSQSWDDFKKSECHLALHAGLRQEQQALCCYCETNINDGDGHIEHIEPRTVNQKRIYDYTNLALSCNGGNAKHCGHYKDNRQRNPGYKWNAARFSSPHDPETRLLFTYDKQSGKICPTKINTDTSAYMIGYLGLNCPSLQERRRSHASRLIDALTEQPGVETRNFLCEYYLKPDTDNYLQSFYSLSKAILEP